MPNNISVSNIVNSIVPISRFNKGEANKIFEEVRESGFKIVLKNNSPACVLLAPEVYEELMETIENYRLLVEAEKRMEKAKSEDFISVNKAMEELGINCTELLDNVDD